MSKFNSPQDEAVYGIVMESGYDEQLGNVDTCVYQASVWVAPSDFDSVGHGYAILTEDSMGFVYVCYFDHHGDWETAWAMVVDSHDRCCLSDDNRE